MHLKKHLSFNALREALSDRFNQIDDLRQNAKVDYPLHDCLMSGFAMMFFQDPSLLAFQQRIQDSIERNNLSTVFNVDTIPKDTQMRDILDTSESQAIAPVFSDFLLRLQRGKQLARYRFIDDMYLISMDGSQYFSSEKINCPNCCLLYTSDAADDLQPV